MPTENSIIKYALLNSLWTALYVILMATFFNSAQRIFGSGQTIMIPIVMLMLFVFSAALCGALVLGRPVLWYLDGRKKDAVSLFAYTLTIFFAVIVIMFLVLYAFR